MKKLIIKTSIITLAIILTVGFALYGLLGLLYPSAIASMAFRLNDKETCISYSEKQYEKTNSVSDLAILTERTVWANEYDLTVKYSSILLSHNDFEDYIKSKPSYDNYIACCLVEALYLTSNINKAIDVAFSFYTGKSGQNTIRILTVTAKEDSDTLKLILKRLKAIENKTTETNYLIEQITNLLN
ncbi:MAG: hypothetical protein J6Q58_01335 [Clostridia bacterium]|nr:hypothetical protein [Clostridia bacterium]